MIHKNIRVIHSRLSSSRKARGLFPGYPMEVPLRLRLVSLFYSLKVPYSPYLSFVMSTQAHSLFKTVILDKSTTFIFFLNLTLSLGNFTIKV